MNAISGMGNTYMQGQGLQQGNRYLDILSGTGQQQAAASGSPSGGGGWGGGGGHQGWGPLPGVASNTPWEGQY